MDEKFMENASALTEKLAEAGIAAVSRKALPSANLEPHQYKRLDCEECEEPLPLFRLQKGLEICVPCLQRRETASRRR